jgi:hypothetical protein
LREGKVSDKSQGLSRCSTHILKVILRNHEDNVVAVLWIVLKLPKFLDDQLAQLLVFVDQADGAEGQKSFDRWRWKSDAGR